MFLGLRSEIHPVSDLAAATSWFSEVLGIEPYFSEVFYVGFNVGGYELGLDPARPADSGPQSYWGVDDVERSLAELVAAGAVARGGIDEVGAGIRMVVVTLPNGAGALGIIENPNFVVAAAASPGPGQ